MTQQTVEERIRKVNEQLMLVLAEDPNVDWAFLKEMTGGFVQKGAEAGNGLDQAKMFYRYNRCLLGTVAAPVAKRPGRKPKAKAEVKAQVTASADKPAKKRGRPRKNPEAPAATAPVAETPAAE